MAAGEKHTLEIVIVFRRIIVEVDNVCVVEMLGKVVHKLAVSDPLVLVRALGVIANRLAGHSDQEELGLGLELFVMLDHARVIAAERGIIVMPVGLNVVGDAADLLI